MKLGMQVALGSGHIVLDGDLAPLPKKGAEPQIFGPCLLWPRSPISATAELLFPIIADKTSVVSTKEQLSVIVRHVDISLQISITEDFLGLGETSETDAETLTGLIENVLIRCGLALDNCRGQCHMTML